jgi:regulator of protease activity HflC (stomatin/prohibitin superfamily)
MDNENLGWGWGVGLIIACILVITILGGFVIVPAGNVNVQLRFGKVIDVQDEGLHFKLPIIDNVKRMSVKTQLFEVKDATAASKDLQDVTTSIAINYKILQKDAGIIYSTIGIDYIEVIAHPAIQEIVKQITSRHNAEDLIINRDAIKDEIANALAIRLRERGIVVEIVNITNFKFSDAFTASIESKVVAQQMVLESENKLKQIEVEARQAEQKAKGEAAATIAIANGQAEANRILGESLTDKIIQYMFIQAIKGNDKVIAIPNGITLTLPTP